MTTHLNKKAVILFSGGLDSTTVLAFAQKEGYTCYCLSFQYGQKQMIELEKAKQITLEAQVAKHLILSLDLDKIGGSALTDTIEVPKDRGLEMDNGKIPITYVPARNTIFLSHAVAWAEVLGATDIFIGINAVDYSGYPDCRPKFLDAFVNMVNIGTRTGVGDKDAFSIQAPLLNMSKAEIIKTGIALGVDYAKTHSCYDPVGEQDAEGVMPAYYAEGVFLRLEYQTQPITQANKKLLIKEILFCFTVGDSTTHYG